MKIRSQQLSTTPPESTVLKQEMIMLPGPSLTPRSVMKSIRNKRLTLDSVSESMKELQDSGFGEIVWNGRDKFYCKPLPNDANRAEIEKIVNFIRYQEAFNCCLKTCESAQGFSIYRKRTSTPLLRLYLFFLFMFQIIFRLLDTALDVLLKFFHFFFKMVSHSLPE